MLEIFGLLKKKKYWNCLSLKIFPGGCGIVLRLPAVHPSEDKYKDNYEDGKNNEENKHKIKHKFKKE